MASNGLRLVVLVCVAGWVCSVEVPVAARQEDFTSGDDYGEEEGEYLEMATDDQSTTAAECEGKTPAFVMGFMGHTGSSAIISVLAKHSQLTIGTREPLDYLSMNESLVEARRIFNTNMEAGRIPGFKMRPFNFGVKANSEDSTTLVIDANLTSQWSEMITDLNIRYIGLTRENYVKKAMGLYEIHVLHDASPVQGLKAKDSADHCILHPELCRFKIDNIRLFAYLCHSSKRGRDIVRQLPSLFPWKCKLELTYEEYLDDNAGTLRRIYDFLGLPEEDNSPLFAKALSDNPCDVVSNFQEVCARLWGCEAMRPFLEDHKNGCYCEDKTMEPEEELCSYEALASYHLDARKNSRRGREQ